MLLLKNNYKLILKIKNEEIVYDGPCLQNATQRQAGCQVDFLIQTRTNNLYLIEIKFYKNKIKKTVINEVKDKIQKLNIPRNMSIRPVLIHVNGVEKPVSESDFFVRIIDFSSLFS